MGHPWLRNVTPGIVYIPAPPVAELARPLRSVAHINSDLLESLLVIWGRNADREDVKAALLSPPGSGTLAKAFYFLLHLYREQTLYDNGILDDDHYGVDGKIITKQYTAPPSRPPSQLGVDSASPHIRSDRDVPVPPSCPPSPNLPSLSKVAPLSVVEKPSRSRPISPSGPRLPKLRPVSSPVPSYTQPRNVRTAPASLVVLDRPSTSRRSSAMPATSLHPIPRSPILQTRDQMVFQPMQYDSPPQTSNMRFPVISPRHSTQPTASHGVARTQVPISTTSLNEPMPLLRAPRTANVELQRAVDDITDRVNILVAHGNAAHALETRQSVHGYVHVQGRGPSLPNTRNGNRQSQGFVHAYGPANFTLPDDDGRDGSDGENKENKDRPYPGSDLMQMTGGLFGKRSGTEDPPKVKEKKNRRKLSGIGRRAIC